MNADIYNILWLDLFDFLTYSKKCQILNCFSKGEDIRKSFLSNEKIRDILTSQEINKMALGLEPQFLDIRLNEYKKMNIECITFYDDRYPYLLKEISSPPLCLYCKGNISLLNSTCVGIVGTRKPTDYGIVATKQYATSLSENGVTIVSGMAAGVDTIAHKTALDKNGPTIAVLAGGFKHIYPASNYNLFKNLIESNLVITENNPDTAPLQYLFPLRNRIIAGLSRAVFVPEAGKKSGSLHTINYAVEYNRDIYALPGKINSPMSEGTNSIIKSFQGSITTSPEDILSALGIAIDANAKNTNLQLDITVQNILDFIKTDKKTFQEILDYTKLQANDLNAILLELELQELVLKLPNNSYILA